MNQFLVVRSVVLACLVVVLSACATNPVTGDQDIVLMSESQEVALGRQNHAEILKQYGVYDSPEVTALVNRIGQSLAAKSHRPHLKYTFTVLDSPEVNAFALPGGYIYITRGIMAYMNSEEELAGVLGHEIGHVTARHGVRQQTAEVGKNVFAVAIAVTTGDKRISRVASTLGTALVSGYGRRHELEADRLGAEYLAKTGYEPEAMLRVIGILKNQEQYAKAQAAKSGKPTVAYHGVFASHPDNDRRLQEVVRAANKYALLSPRRTDDQAFISLADNMVFGDSEAQGIVDNNQFFHRDFDLTLRFPEGWSLQNQPDRLVGVNPARNQLIQMSLGASDAAMQPTQFLRQNFEDLRGLQALRSGSAIGVATVQTPWGSRSSRVGAVKHHQHTLVMLGTGQHEAPGTGFLETLESVKPLSAEDQLRARAKRLKTYRVRRGDSYQSLAATSSLTKNAEAQLRLLNGQYPSGELQAGQLIKIVQ